MSSTILRDMNGTLYPTGIPSDNEIADAWNLTDQLPKRKFPKERKTHSTYQSLVVHLNRLKKDTPQKTSPIHPKVFHVNGNTHAANFASILIYQRWITFNGDRSQRRRSPFQSRAQMPDQRGIQTRNSVFAHQLIQPLPSEVKKPCQGRGKEW